MVAAALEGPRPEGEEDMLVSLVLIIAFLALAMSLQVFVEMVES